MNDDPRPRSGDGYSLDQGEDQSLLDEFRRRHESKLDDARREQLSKQVSAGKKTARQRIDMLVDSGSFLETGTLVEAQRNGHSNVELDAPADGVITGSATIGGRPVEVVSYDYSVYAGSNGDVGNRKVDRHTQLAVTHGHPLVLLMEGGGHRIQEGLDARHFARGFKTLQIQAALSGWAPIVAAIMGPGFAGATSFAALADFVVMVDGISTMGVAGPALVKAATGEEVDKEELGGAQQQANVNGIADLVVDSEEECIDRVREFLNFLPTNAQLEPPYVDPTEPSLPVESLRTVVPAERKRPYDAWAIVGAVFDGGSAFEVKPGYAKNALTILARLGGHPVGVVANQPMVLGGALDSPAAEKIAHFVSMCDAFGLPLVYFIDVPGFMVGTTAEATGLGRRAGKMLFELGQATVPRFSVVIRKGYGLAYGAMNGGRSFDPDLALAWPTAEISAMAVEGAVDVLYRREVQNSEDPAAARAELIAEFRSQLTSFRAAEDYGIDQIVDPAETRWQLLTALERCARRRHVEWPPKKHGIPPI